MPFSIAESCIARQLNTNAQSCKEAQTSTSNSVTSSTTTRNITPKKADPLRSQGSCAQGSNTWLPSQLALQQTSFVVSGDKQTCHQQSSQPAQALPHTPLLGTMGNTNWGDRKRKCCAKVACGLGLSLASNSSSSSVVAHHQLQVCCSILCVCWFDVEGLYQLLHSIRSEEGGEAGAQPHIAHTEAQESQQHSHGLLLKPATAQQYTTQ